MSPVPPARLPWPSALLRSAAVVVAVLAALIPAAPAQAHNQLLSATPEADAVLESPPDEVVLTFLERLDPKFTTIAVTDAQKQAVATDGPKVSGSTATVAFPQPLPDGVYTVAYRVVSLDGHPVQGAYRFTVGDPGTEDTGSGAAPSATPSVEPSPVAADEDDPGTDGSTLTVAALVAVAVLLGAAGVLVSRRRRGARR